MYIFKSVDYEEDHQHETINDDIFAKVKTLTDNFDDFRESQNEISTRIQRELLLLKRSLSDKK